MEKFSGKKKNRLDTPEPTVSVKKPPLPEKPERSSGPAVLPYVVFARLSKRRADEIAGFAHWARKYLPARNTMADWETAYQEFEKRAVR